MSKNFFLSFLVGEVDRELAEWQNSEGCHQRRLV